MSVLRLFEDVQLNQGDGMAKGLYNLSNNKTNEVSLWFDEDEKNAMMSLSDIQFLHEARVKFEYAEMYQ